MLEITTLEHLNEVELQKIPGADEVWRKYWSDPIKRIYLRFGGLRCGTHNAQLQYLNAETGDKVNVK